MSALAFLNQWAESKSNEWLAYALTLDFGYTQEQVDKMDRSDLIHRFIVEWRLHGIGFGRSTDAEIQWNM